MTTLSPLSSRQHGGQYEDQGAQESAQAIPGRHYQLPVPGCDAGSRDCGCMVRKGGVAMKGRYLPIYVDGKLMSYSAIRTRFHVSYSTISSVLEKIGRDIPSSAFLKKTTKPQSSIQKKTEDRSTGWAERKYFPNAGINGA